MDLVDNSTQRDRQQQMAIESKTRKETIILKDTNIMNWRYANVLVQSTDAEMCLDLTIPMEVEAGSSSLSRWKEVIVLQTSFAMDFP